MLAQRHAIGLAGQLLQQIVIQGELRLGIAAAGITIRHQQCHVVALRRRWKRGQEIAARFEHRSIFFVAGIGIDQPGMQFRTRSRLRKAFIKKRYQFSRTRTMEVRKRALLFFRIVISRRTGVQDQRQDAIQVAGAGIHGGNVFVHGDIAGAKADLIFGSGQENIHHPGQGFLVSPRPGCCKAQSNSAPLPDRDALHPAAARRYKAPAQSAGLARIFLQPIVGDGLLCRLQIAPLLVIIEDTGHGIEIVRIACQRGVCLIQKLAQAARISRTRSK